MTELTQKDKLQTLLNDKSVRAGTALSDLTNIADPEKGGRFAQQSTPIVGVPPQPPNSPWACDPVPPEPLVDMTCCASNTNGSDCT